MMSGKLRDFLMFTNQQNKNGINVYRTTTVETDKISQSPVYYSRCCGMSKYLYKSKRTLHKIYFGNKSLLLQNQFS